MLYSTQTNYIWHNGTVHNMNQPLLAPTDPYRPLLGRFIVKLESLARASASNVYLAIELVYFLTVLVQISLFALFGLKTKQKCDKKLPKTLRNTLLIT